MALIVEDGTAKEDSNSFVTYQQAVDISDNLGLDLPSEQTITEKLLKQTAFLFSKYEHLFSGERTERDQSLIYPRRHVVFDCHYHDEIKNDMIPLELQRAQVAMVSYMFLNGLSNTANNAPNTSNLKRKKIDGVEWEYSETSTSTSTNQKLIFNAGREYMRALLKSTCCMSISR